VATPNPVGVKPIGRGCPRGRRAPRYRQKATISYADMLAALRRELIRQDFGHKHPR
jgi:hypothetical protein